MVSYLTGVHFLVACAQHLVADANFEVGHELVVLTLATAEGDNVQHLNIEKYNKKIQLS